MFRVAAAVLLFTSLVPGQGPVTDQFHLALSNHNGQLEWSAPGFRAQEFSAKPNGGEIGVRASDSSGRISFLSFLFLFPEQGPLTSENCASGVMDPAKKQNPRLKVTSTSTHTASSGPAITLVSYTVEANAKPTYVIRAFVAQQDICGDLEIYSESPLTVDMPAIKTILDTYRLDPAYAPQFKDVFLFAQVLYNKRLFQAAGPVYETALAKLNDDTVPDAKTMRRVLTDQAGMSYGISGDIAKARAIFHDAIAHDPDYPMYYYNLACADAEEKNLDAARKHLQQAFDRKANMVRGEKMPDPTQDDSFTPYRNNKQFWSFIEDLKSR